MKIQSLNWHIIQKSFKSIIITDYPVSPTEKYLPNGEKKGI